MSSRTLEVLREGWIHLARRPLRSGLSAVTCAVAIAVTVNVISLSYGMDEDIRRDVSRFGRNTIDLGRLPILLPGMERERLGPDELRRIDEMLADLPHASVPRRQGLVAVAGDAEVGRVPVIAVPSTYPRTLGVGLKAGRWFGDRDDPSRVVALDESAVALLFPGRTPAEVVGRPVRLTDEQGTREAEVLGVLEDPMTYRALFEAFDQGRASRTLSSGLLSFRNLYVPEAALPGDEYSGISIAMEDEADVPEAARRLRTVWASADVEAVGPRRSVGVFVRREWMEGIGAVTQMGASLGNLVWIIVVGVAAILISTLYLMTIRERYDEIAVRRCEGARRRDVALQVTAEGTVVALVGGLVGLPLGSLGADVLRAMVGFPFRFEARYAVVATGIAVLLGLVSSVLPARRAARLDPAAILSRRVL